MAGFIMLLGGALGTNLVFFCLVLISLGFARVRSFVYAKPWLVYVPFGIGVVWYLIMFAFQFVEPPQSVLDLSSYYVETALGVIVFLIIGVVGIILIRKRIAKTKNKWGDND